jgi:hypothetical protein
MLCDASRCMRAANERDARRWLVMDTDSREPTGRAELAVCNYAPCLLFCFSCANVALPVWHPELVIVATARQTRASTEWCGGRRRLLAGKLAEGGKNY